MVQINDLPEELLEYILYFVSPYEDWVSCKLVCHRWFLSCTEVVKKRKSRFFHSLKNGYIKWYTPNVSNTNGAITRRYSHSSCMYDCYMYIFGGCTPTNTTFNDLWKFNLGTNEWTRILSMGTYPSPKAYASMVPWKENLLLFGGWTHPSVYPLHQQWVLFNELHSYSILENRWTQLYYDGCPPATAGHTSTIHGDVLVIFGGLQRKEGMSNSTNEIYCLDLEKQLWYQPIVSLLKPEPRYGHSQIKINERNILILSGCGGSNKLYTDIWLLTIPENIVNSCDTWQWTSISVNGIENMPTQMWYNPACKVDDKIIMLSAWQCPTESASSPGKMHQLFVPGIIRRQAGNNALPLSQPNQSDGLSNEQIDVNVNGQRGSLRLPSNRMDASTSSESDDNSDSPKSRPRHMPSIRPNATSNQARRMHMLSRMEVRIKQLQNNIHTEAKGRTTHENRLVAHVLDIKNVIAFNNVSWRPVKLNSRGFPSYVGCPPEPCLLYSLLMGRGHLIIFGGIPNEPTGNQQETASNQITYLLNPS